MVLVVIIIAVSTRTDRRINSHSHILAKQTCRQVARSPLPALYTTNICHSSVKRISSVPVHFRIPLYHGKSYAYAVQIQVIHNRILYLGTNCGRLAEVWTFRFRMHQRLSHPLFSKFRFPTCRFRGLLSTRYEGSRAPTAISFRPSDGYIMLAI